MHGEHFEDTIEMRDVTGNRIIGTGAEGLDVEAPAGISSLSVVTAVSGALLVEVDSQRAQDLDLQYVQRCFRSFPSLLTVSSTLADCRPGLTLFRCSPASSSHASSGPSSTAMMGR